MSYILCIDYAYCWLTNTDSLFIFTCILIYIRKCSVDYAEREKCLIEAMQNYLSTPSSYTYPTPLPTHAPSISQFTTPNLPLYNTTTIPSLFNTALPDLYYLNPSRPLICPRTGLSSTLNKTNFQVLNILPIVTIIITNTSVIITSNSNSIAIN